LRVFRDDTRLSATPHLWPTIETALSRSRLLILLAWPKVGGITPGQEKELAYWLAHKGTDTLLIAATDGEPAWDTAAGFAAGAPLPAIPREPGSQAALDRPEGASGWRHAVRCAFHRAGGRMRRHDGTLRLWSEVPTFSWKFGLEFDQAQINPTDNPDFHTRTDILTEIETDKKYQFLKRIEELLKAPDFEGITAARRDLPRCLHPLQRRILFLSPAPPRWCLDLAKWPFDTPDCKQRLALSQPSLP
jgi:hypothetical protein